jgi:uncharacterized phage-associated protein
MHKAVKVANEFIKIGTNCGKPLTPMQVIKLVYIAHGLKLGFLKESLIEDDVEAWKYGPVIDSVYQPLKMYRGDKITCEIKLQSSEILPKEDKDIIEGTFNRYGYLSGAQLSALTHQKDTPWRITWDKWGQYSPGVVIPKTLIQNYYEQRIKAG